MAISLIVEYVGQIDGTDLVNYPTGKPINVSAPAASDGTPLEEAWMKDLHGFLQAIISEGNITISGNPDTVPASDHLGGLKAILLQRSELRSEGGDILAIGNRLPTNHIDGLRLVRTSGVLLLTNPGSVRSGDDSIDITLASQLEKDISATWTQGAGGGGMPSSLLATTDDWLRVFLVIADDGAVDISVDTSATATNFLADANAIAAGFAAAGSSFRRIGWVRLTSSALVDFNNSAADPRRFVWDVQKAAHASTTLSNGSRQAIALAEDCPENVMASLTCGVDFTGASNGYVLMTEATQVDSTATSGRWTVRGIGPGDNVGTVTLDLQTDALSQVFARRSAAGTLESAGFEVLVNGWSDPAIIA